MISPLPNPLRTLVLIWFHACHCCTLCPLKTLPSLSFSLFSFQALLLIHGTSAHSVLGVLWIPPNRPSWHSEFHQLSSFQNIHCFISALTSEWFPDTSHQPRPLSWISKFLLPTVNWISFLNAPWTIKLKLLITQNVSALCPVSQPRGLSIHFQSWQMGVPLSSLPGQEPGSHSQPPPLTVLPTSAHTHRYTQSTAILCFYGLPVSWRPQSRHWGRRGMAETENQCHLPKIHLKIQWNTCDIKKSNEIRLCYKFKY